MTQEEREAGANAVATCLTEAGFEDVSVSVDGDDFSTGYVVASEDEDELARTDALFDGCQDQIDGIEAVWFLQNDDSLLEFPLPGLEAALERLDVDS